MYDLFFLGYTLDSITARTRLHQGEGNKDPCESMRQCLRNLLWGILTRMSYPPRQPITVTDALVHCRLFRTILRLRLSH